jgi:hypothetical protein
MVFVSAADAQGVSQATLRMVVARAAQIGTVDSVEAERSNAVAAAIAINPDTSSLPNSASAIPVTLFELHGSFDDVEAKVPAGGTAPRGDVIAYIVNQKEEIAATYIGNQAIPLRGAVQHFRSAQDRAIIAHANHKLSKAPRRGSHSE